MLKIFANHVKRAEHYQDSKLKAVIPDNGMELVNQSFKNYCNENGIKHEFTDPKQNTPKQNGCCECFNQTIMDGVRTVVADNNSSNIF